jgi:ABC-type antimicrobial peptide transport system permease subunit
VGDVAEEALTDDHRPARYSLFSRVPYFPEAQTLVIRTGGQEAAAILDAARRTVQQVSPGVPVRGSTTAARVLDIAVGPARQLMSLLGMLSALALALGAVGIYGVISHFAASRQRDWAIRVALGLPGSRVVTTIVGQGTALVCAGIVLGAVGALMTARLLVSFLFGVSFLDTLALGAASIAVLSIGTVAALIPAWRAGAVDPALTLRKP